MKYLVKLKEPAAPVAAPHFSRWERFTEQQPLCHSLCHSEAKDIL